MTFFLIFGGVMIVLLIAIFLQFKAKTESLLLKQQLALQQNLESSSQSVQKQMVELTKDLSSRLQDGFKIVQEANQHVGTRLDRAATVVGEVQNRLGKMEEATARIFEVGKDLSSLQEILRAPKLRGNLGELFLTDLLAQVLPKNAFELQYTFKTTKQKVDAVIRSVHGLICVDSKFPMENFLRLTDMKTTEAERNTARRTFYQDVKKHINAIAQKYILPDEGTLDLALMYIPAENVYYEIILKDDGSEKDLLSYAQERRVFPVSPISFYAYLQTLLLGFKGLQLQDGIREVLDNVGRLKREFGNFAEEFSKVGSHLLNARGSYEKADKKFQLIGEKLDSLAVREVDQKLRVLKGGEGGEVGGS